jgi:hypothetical protein
MLATEYLLPAMQQKPIGLNQFQSAGYGAPGQIFDKLSPRGDFFVCVLPLDHFRFFAANAPIPKNRAA